MTSIFKSFRYIALFLLSIEVSYAGAGKIVGTVTDYETGSALPYVNVIIHELNIGASTDINGYYIILNIPPGEYSVSASFIGYQNTKYEGVQCATGHTTVQNFTLPSAVISGEEVVVIAKRPLVQKDLTASQKITTSAEINAMPVESFLDVLTTQAGVNTGADGAIHIRGGRSNEVGFYIDGISVVNPFTGSLAMNVSNNALQEMKVISGAFNAEYGNAMSGIINIQLREGGELLDGSVTYYTGDYLSNNSQVFPNIDAYNPMANSVLEAALTGPILGRKLTFNISARLHNNGGYLYGIREHAPEDSANFQDGDEWYIESSGDSSYVSMNPSISGNGLAKFTWRISPRLKMSFQGLYDQSQSKAYVHTYKYNPDGIYQYLRENGGIAVRLNQSFGSTFYELNLYYNSTNYRKYVYEDPADLRYVSTSNIVGSPGSTTFAFGGTLMEHDNRNSKTLGTKFDITSQIGSHHEIKAGLDVKTDHLESDDAVILYNGQRYREPTILPANLSPSHSTYTGDATFFSAYAQDKLEYESMIMNVGLRYDFFEPNGEFPTNLLDPTGTAQAADSKHSISPRLGVSFPITDKGYLHFSYGHFYQLPTLTALYSTSIFGANITPSLGYTDLKPEKTVLYEFGLQQQFGEYIALEAIAFYKDIRDLLATQSIYYESAVYGPSNYSIRLNKDYGTVLGYTLSLSKPHDPASHLSGHLDYTYQTTEGNATNSGSFFFSQFSETEEAKQIVYLSWDQTHLINGTVTYSVPNKWGISLIGKLASGWPYTPTIPLANYNPIPNSERKPWQRNIDLRMHKNIQVGNFETVLFAMVFNLLDELNERYVYDDTGQAGYTYVNQSSEETAEFKSHYGEPGIHTWSEYQVRPTYYSSPRSTYLGITLEF
ncbi:MAG: TonB-dependent receptor [Candidatus Marinimicrobia bacterium]|nr:TonB-dependent receptor [Candidatus Neomarinimicrobiota bacterium]